MSNAAPTQADRSATPAVHPALGASLLVLATAQLMLVLDDTVANIALPSIQRDLGVSAATLPWIVNAYVLAFGSLLLFGGRVGDLFGRRRVLRAGLVVFALASLLGALGVNAAMLIASRGLQGLGAALIAPNALALIATTFPVGAPRNKAMGVYGAMSALGITVGVLLGGVLTAIFGWRAVFFINVPIGLAVLAGTKALVEGQRNRGRLNVADALTGTGALFALAYGITRGGEHGWTDPMTLFLFAAAVVLGAVFLRLQARREDPMLPLGLFGDRNRAGSYVAMLFGGAAVMGGFYLLTLLLQQVMQFSPLRTGLSSLPFSAGIILGAGVASKLAARLAPRAVAGPGLMVMAAGMFLLSMLTPSASYFASVMPGVFLLAFGFGLTAVAMTLTAVHGVAEAQAGVASALVNMAQQIGAAFGLAVFTTISLAAAERRLPGAGAALHGAQPVNDPGVLARVGEALTYGYTTAYLAGSTALLIVAVLVALAVNTRRTQGAAPATLL
jgi:EmrB/QacA subfamily drug resistance transporter